MLTLCRCHLPGVTLHEQGTPVLSWGASGLSSFGHQLLKLGGTCPYCPICESHGEILALWGVMEGEMET